MREMLIALDASNYLRAPFKMSAEAVYKISPRFYDRGAGGIPFTV
jgi:hypothetical protein